MSLNQDKEKLMKKNKDQLADLVLKLQTDKLNIINDKLDVALVELATLKGQMESLKTENEKLESSLKITENTTNLLGKQIIQLERNFYKHQQYCRRDSVEISGIPLNIENEDLLANCIEVFKEVDVDISNDDVIACHRLKNKSRTIVKFTNRNQAEYILKNKKKLKSADLYGNDTKIFLGDSLCPYYKHLLWVAKSLYQQKIIAGFGSFHGSVSIKLRNDATSINILHMNDFKNQFPNFSFANYEYIKSSLSQP